jgi:hypothetical protein
MKLTNLILLFLASILIMGCTQTISEEIDKDHEPTTQELLQGDWVTEKFGESFGKHFFHINIEGSRFKFLSKYSDSVDFKLVDSLITVFDSTYVEQKGKTQSYNLIRFDENNLHIFVNSTIIKDLLVQYKWDSDTIKFRKLVKKNDLQPESIEFSSSGCFGTCPIMKIKINSDYSFVFLGEYHTDKIGIYSGKMKIDDYNSIIKQLQQISLDSVKLEHAANWTDDQTRNLIIKTKDTIIKTSVYGVDKEPKELTVFLNRLMELYKGLGLKENDSIDKESTFDKFLDWDGYYEEELEMDIEGDLQFREMLDKALEESEKFCPEHLKEEYFKNKRRTDSIFKSLSNL